MLREARGMSRLAVDAVSGAADISEDLHRTILRLAPVVGQIPAGNASGLTGLVYRSVRGIARAAGTGIDAVLSPFDKGSRDRPSPRREAVLAALNGVLGDHLKATGNPLAIPMRLRHRGVELGVDPESLGAQQGSRLLVMVHGLCMNDLQWHRGGRDLGTSLGEGFGFTPLHLHYNSGLAIAHNGEAFSELLQQLVEHWPRRVEELVIVAHSMGGLLTQTAWRHAQTSGFDWPKLTSQRFYLGSPLHGAPLERSGEWFNTALAHSPYLAPFTRLGNIRSQGIKDLRHGIAADGLPRSATRGLHLVAASRQVRPTQGRPAGDGLVPIDSALGRRDDSELAPTLAERRKHVVWDCSHIDLLWHPGVHDRITRWMRQR